MAKNDYEVLADQIGNAGAEEQPKQKGLGKVQHQEIIGGKASLSGEEEKSREEFESKVSQMREAKQIPITQGWIPLDRSELGIRSIFYPKDWDFYIKPATVQAVKNWTAIDETRADQVNRVLNEIVKSCVKIDTHNPLQTAGWMKINSWDRFWFILKVREATFTRGETSIEFEDECSECGETIKYTLTSNSLFYEFPDDDLIEKYWDGQQWNIDPREYDVDHEPITLYTPTLGKDDAIIEWATARARMNQKIDETFVRFLMWMLPKPAKDAQMLDRQIEKLYKEYKSWSVEMYEFMDDVVRNITINPSEQLRQPCPYCGQEATSNVRFPNGIKVLFKSETKAKKFGSR